MELSIIRNQYVCLCLLVCAYVNEWVLVYLRVVRLCLWEGINVCMYVYLFVYLPIKYL